MEKLRKSDLIGIGNAITDIIVRVDEDVLKDLALEKGEVTLADDALYKKTMSVIKEKDPVIMGGGSAANSIILACELGTRVGFVCTVGDDELGRSYIKDMELVGVDLCAYSQKEGRTGVSVVFVTPDGERTMCTHLGVAGDIKWDRIPKDWIVACKNILVEGYLLYGTGNNQSKLYDLLRYIKENGHARIVMSLSDSVVVRECREVIEDIIGFCDLIVGNKREIQAMSNVSDEEEAFELFKERGIDFVMTRSEKGVWAYIGEEDIFAEGQPAELIDATGAGDAWLGAFLHGMDKGFSARESCHRANMVASKIVEKIGARFEGDVLKVWNRSQ